MDGEPFIGLAQVGGQEEQVGQEAGESVGGGDARRGGRDVGHQEVGVRRGRAIGVVMCWAWLMKYCAVDRSNNEAWYKSVSNRNEMNGSRCSPQRVEGKR